MAWSPPKRHSKFCTCSGRSAGKAHGCWVSRFEVAGGYTCGYTGIAGCGGCRDRATILSSDVGIVNLHRPWPDLQGQVGQRLAARCNALFVPRVQLHQLTVQVQVRVVEQGLALRSEG